MPVHAYINFDQQAKDAIHFYEQVFDLEPTRILTYGGFQGGENYQAPEHIKDLVMHAELSIFDSRVMVSDTPRGFGHDYVLGNHITLAITSNQFESLKRAYDRLSKGATIITAFAPTFFSGGYGYLIDSFGIGWQFILE
jgi:PhnB protein